jgi:hypothetical protein
MAEVGEQFGLTRTRIDQILKQEGVTRQQGQVATDARRRAIAFEHRDEILTHYREGLDPAGIAQHLSVTTVEVQDLVRSEATPADRASRKAAMTTAREPRLARYTDSDLVDAVRRVAAGLGEVPTCSQYAELSSSLQLPSLPTVAHRLGGWSAALSAAGLEPNRPPRAYKRRWPSDECWRALQRLADELGGLPTANQYELIASSSDDLPSLATVRHRLGRWSSVSARLHTASRHPLLGRLGIDEAADPEVRDETIWLAYLQDEVSEEELEALAGVGLFRWQDSFGERPSWADHDEA